MTANPTPPTRSPGRGLRIALVLSLAVNLLILGAVAGMLWRHAGPDGLRMRGAPPGLGSYALPYVQALPVQDRRALHDALREGEAGRRQSRAARRAAYADVLSALRAEPFDADVLRAALARQRDTVMTVQDRAQALWLDRVRMMDAPARAAFADRIEEALSAPRHHPGRRGRP